MTSAKINAVVDREAVANLSIDHQAGRRDDVRMNAGLMISAMLLAFPVEVMAQNFTSPDIRQVRDVDTSRWNEPSVIENGYKFYYFYRPATDFAHAYRDLQECRAYLPQSGPALLPGFIPIDEAHRRITPQSSPAYGLVGAGIAAIIMPKMERGLRSNKMRRCMGTRGYDRYAIAEDSWNALNEGDEGQILAMQAKLASGPKPQGEPVTR